MSCPRNLPLLGQQHSGLYPVPLLKELHEPAVIWLNRTQVNEAALFDQALARPLHIVHSHGNLREEDASRSLHFLLVDLPHTVSALLPV